MNKEWKAKELEQLRKDAEYLQECVDHIFAAARAITGEEAEDAYTFDYIYNGLHTAEELLERVKNEDVSNDPS